MIYEHMDCRKEGSKASRAYVIKISVLIAGSSALPMSAPHLPCDIIERFAAPVQLV